MIAQELGFDSGQPMIMPIHSVIAAPKAIPAIKKSTTVRKRT
jgi:hypothetical protein